MVLSRVQFHRRERLTAPRGSVDECLCLEVDMTRHDWMTYICSTCRTLSGQSESNTFCVVCAHLCSPWVIGCVLIFCVWSVLIYVHHGSLGVSWSSVCGLCSSMFTMGHWVCHDLLCVVCAHLCSPWVIGCVMNHSDYCAFCGLLLELCGFQICYMIIH